MKDQHSHLEIALASIACFQNNGSLDETELNQLVSIAERDGSIDSDEARVLSTILDKLVPDELDASMRARRSTPRTTRAVAVGRQVFGRCYSAVGNIGKSWVLEKRADQCGAACPVGELGVHSISQLRVGAQ